ncbi:MAG TPA: hypothetical protein VM050_04425, partial [Patescibacteria group bacterium]|nr:hypothetical protein [Patescibacteria group bacterium]
MSEASLEGALPYLFSLQVVMGGLQLLDVLSVVYYPMIRGRTDVVRFELGVSLVPTLVLAFVLWVGWFASKRDYRVLVYPAAALVLYPFFGVGGVMAAANLVAVVAGLRLHGGLGRFASGFFIVLSGFEALALLHWVVFLPFGLVSPVEGVAWVEVGVFYVASYLVPLLVLPLLFMWVLRPLIRWGWGRDLVTQAREVNAGQSRGVILLLVFSLFLGLVASLYPYGSGV